MKTLFLDIEYEPSEAYVWKLWKEDIPIQRLKKEGGMICWGAKWLDNDELFQGTDLEGIYELLEEADIVVTYNGARADLPFLNKEFVKIGLPPPAPFKHIDLYKVVKKEFKLPSNKLEYVAKAFGLVNQKLGHEGFGLWVDCMNGDEEALKRMMTYNAGDVFINEELYIVLLPWIRNHPHVAIDEEHACPSCGGHHLQKRGYSYTGVSKFQRYQCMECYSWSRGRKNLGHKGALAR